MPNIFSERVFWLRALIVVGLLIAFLAGHVFIPLDGAAAVSVGGALLPGLVAVILFLAFQEVSTAIILASGVMILIGYCLSGQTSTGVGTNTLALASSGALVALIFTRQHPSIVAYISTTFGMLIGGDLLHIQAPPPGAEAVIGGNGTSDAVLLVGVFAAFFASAGSLWVLDKNKEAKQ